MAAGCEGWIAAAVGALVVGGGLGYAWGRYRGGQAWRRMAVQMAHMNAQLLDHVDQLHAAPGADPGQKEEGR